MEGNVLRCRSCKKLLPNGSALCMYCGAAQAKLQKKKKATRRPMNSGTVRKLPGNRTKPYAAYLPRSMGEKFIGSYDTAAKASDAIALAISSRPASDRADWTLLEFYNSFKASNAYDLLSDSAKQSHRTAWKYLSVIESLPMRSIKTAQIQSVVNSASEAGKSRAICEKIKNLASRLCQLAMAEDVMDKNYAQLLDLPKSNSIQKDEFTLEEIKLLKNHDSDIQARLILILIFSGMRISELLMLKVSDINTDGWYAIGGEKTEAGRNRIIPLIHTVQPYIENLMEGKTADDLLVTMPDGKKMSRDYFARFMFKKYLIKLGILTQPEDGEKWRLSPHCTRHTNASLSVKLGIDKDILARVLGHVDYEQVTDKHYVHMEAQFLSAEMSKLNDIL